MEKPDKIVAIAYLGNEILCYTKESGVIESSEIVREGKITTSEE